MDTNVKNTVTLKHRIKCPHNTKLLKNVWLKLQAVNSFTVTEFSLHANYVVPFHCPILLDAHATNVITAISYWHAAENRTPLTEYTNMSNNIPAIFKCK